MEICYNVFYTKMIIYKNKIQSLGTFFTKLKNVDKLEAFLRAQDILSEEAFQKLKEVYARSPFDSTYSAKRGWLKVETGSKIGEEGSFYLIQLHPVRLPEGEELVELGSLSDTIDPDRSSIFIEDSKIHVKSDSTGYYLMLHKSEDYTVIENKTLYADYHGVNNYYLYRRFGSVIGAPRRKDSLKYLIELRAIWQALMEKTDKDYLLKALTAVLGLPIGYESGTITEVGTDFITVNYDNLGYVSHIHSQLRPFNVGDSISQFEPLTDLIKIYDGSDNYSSGMLAELSDKLISDIIKTRIFHKDSFSYVYLSYLEAGPGNTLIIGGFKPTIIDIVEDNMTVNDITLIGKFAKIPKSDTIFQNGQLIEAGVTPSYDQLYQYSKKMIYLVQILTEVPVAETGAMKRFVDLYEPTHNYIFISFANYIADADSTPEIDISDTNSEDFTIDATERVHRYILSNLGGDETNIYDKIEIV